MMVRSYFLLTISGLILASCATQEPAPVEFGTELTSPSQSRSTNSGGSSDISSRKFNFESDNRANARSGENQEHVLRDNRSRAQYIDDGSSDSTSYRENKNGAVSRERVSHEDEAAIEHENVKQESKEDLDSELSEFTHRDKKHENIARSDDERLEEDLEAKPVKKAASSPEPLKEQALEMENLKERAKEQANAPHENQPILDNINASLSKPVDGKIINKFGDMVNGSKNNGINFAGDSGDPVRAAASGTVAHVGVDGKFGNIVIIKHGNTSLQTAYAHLSSVEVQKGQIVTEGDLIGTLGQTGDAELPMLHFAVRNGKVPVDPLPYLK